MGVLHCRGLAATFCSTGLMTDILNRDDTRRFWDLGQFRRAAEPVARRSESRNWPRRLIRPMSKSTEAYDLVAGFQFGNADEFSDQRFADEEQFALPHDLAVAAHTPHLVIGIIPRVLKALWHGARRCRIELGGQSLIQRLVRALLVVVSAEVVKADLLFGPACCRRARGLRLERAMHPLRGDRFLAAMPDG